MGYRGGKRLGSDGKQKSLPIPQSGLGRPAFPGTLSVEELVERKFPGRLPGFRVIAASPAFPFVTGRTVAGSYADQEGGCGSPITVAGPRPISTAFPFNPDSFRGHHGNISFQRTEKRTNFIARGTACQGRQRRSVPVLPNLAKVRLAQQFVQARKVFLFDVSPVFHPGLYQL
jgi:hypothetical protein